MEDDKRWNAEDSYFMRAHQLSLASERNLAVLRVWSVPKGKDRYVETQNEGRSQIGLLVVAQVCASAFQRQIFSERVNVASAFGP